MSDAKRTMHRANSWCWCVLLLFVVLHAAAQKETETKPSNETAAVKPTSQTVAEPTESKAPEEDAKKSTSTKEPAKPMATTKGCKSGCEICHEDHCFSCSSGYHRINYACEKKGCVDDKCVDCSSDVCYKCVDGYAPDLDGICSWIGPTGCDEENCKLCEATRIGCTECDEGYQLRGNKCVKKACADTNCKRCSSDGKECEVCSEGYQSRLGKCMTLGCNDEECRKCSPSGGSCYQCNEGYHVDLYHEGHCKQCPDTNCVNCNGSQQSCIKCKTGYFVRLLKSGKVGCAECHKAVDHCSKCSRNGDECFACLPGYYLEHGHCIECTADCSQCKSPWFCDVCADGYDLTGSGSCQAGENVKLSSSDSAGLSIPIITFIAAGLFHLLLFGAFVL